jgi:DNA polymerase I-like protein with 3'-5' exonuclease and polymerase domains
VVPDPGTYWLCWDYDAIEARLGACFCGDVDDLQAFAQGWDIHTMTVCHVMRYPLPPNLVDPHTSPECETWRTNLMWAGKEDKRRVQMKTARYADEYGSDFRAILQAKDIEKIGLSRDELLDVSERYLRSKPHKVAFKKRMWGEVLATREARTFLGRRRRLFPKEGELASWRKSGRATPTAREGLNHLYQGATAGIMNRALRVVIERWPTCRLAYQTHDGAKMVFPETVECWPEVRELVEQEYEINGHTMRFTATWGRQWSDGGKESL